MLGRQTLIVMVAGYAGLALVGCGGSQSQQPTTGAQQCPAGYYFNGQYCQPPQAAVGTPAGGAVGAPAPTPGVVTPPAGPAPGAPAAAPAATTPVIATAAASGPTATALDPTAAQAATMLIGPLAQQHAVAGSKATGSALAGNFQQGQSLETQVTMNPGKCYTIVGVGVPPVQNVDLQLASTISIPGMGAPVAAADNTQGTTALIGAKPNCYKWPFPMAGTMKLTLTVSAGQGLAAAQIYEK